MNWIKQLLSRRQLDRDLREEIQEHLDESIEELVAGGMSRDDATRAARRAFGNITRTRDRSRDVWRWRAVEDFFVDVHFALRQLRKSPTFALASVLTLALGIGANTAIFSVVNAVILRPLPYPDPDRLVSVQSRDTRGTPHPAALSYPTFFDFRRDNDVFEHIASFRDTQLSLTGSGRPVRLRGAIVSWDLFAVLKTAPALGRGFLPHEEEAGARVVVLSHGLWSTRYGGDPDIVGRAITLNREAYTVVGVAPAGFNFPALSDTVDLWTTLALDATSATQRGSRMLNAIARLRPGVTVEQAQTHMDAVAAALVERYPDQNKSIASTYVRPMLDRLVGDTREPFLVLLGAVGLILLIACANIASLLLARMTERAREFALRAAIGAGQGRLVRQLVTESLTLSLIACTAGVLTAIGLLRWALPLAGDSVPRILQSNVDGRVLIFSIALAVLTGILVSVAPALRLARVDVVDPLKAGARTSTDTSGGLRSTLVVAQIALCLVLLCGATLLVASFLNLVGRDLGFQPERLLTFSLNLPGAEYPAARQHDFYDRLLERLQSLPDVTAAAVARPLPLTGSQMTISFNIEQRPTPPWERPSSNMAIVSPGYFKAIGTPLLEGRALTEQDDAARPPVLVVNRAFADKFFPGDEIVGKRIEPGASLNEGGTTMREIVGIVDSVRQSPLSSEEEPIYYFAYRQLPWCCPSVVVRTSASPLAIESSLRAVVESMDAQLPIYDVRTAEDLLSTGIAGPRFLTTLFASFAALALLLTAVGLYGVIAYSVARRTREMGVRIALGASRATVLAMVLKKAMFLVVMGIGVGLVGTLAGAQLVAKMLYGVAPHEPRLLVLACSVVTITAAVAAYLPARRAATIDPMQALRSE
ncbi:MAG: FtsX-like permease family protein [Luteitalea sp.]|nr:FtsX-like permease family protein [Luteitalea sp.]